MAASRRNTRRRQKKITVSSRLRVLLTRLQSGVSVLLPFSALMVLAVVFYLGMEALRGVPVERIVVTGKIENLRQEALRDALSGHLDGGLLFLSLSDLQGTLEALPWVYTAELRRRFPDTLEVSVVEQLPIARWGDEAFLNHEARIIGVTDGERWQDLPEIRGPEGSEGRLMNHYQRLLERLRPLQLTPTALSEDAYGQLYARLDNGLELQLGDHDFSLRLQRFLLLWKNDLKDADRLVRRVDMRYDGGAAVAFDQTPQLAGLTENPQVGRQ
ncbi:cell division protein FtsQ/DivIB [Congregibacter sp.]|uniref:cell division protein FtsQ/DivIB n=1 Tax=Congregibacter sp. TaxID=2744308 RepID=UPI003F6D2B30